MLGLGWSGAFDGSKGLLEALAITQGDTHVIGAVFGPSPKKHQDEVREPQHQAKMSSINLKKRAAPIRNRYRPQCIRRPVIHATMLWIFADSHATIAMGRYIHPWRATPPGEGPRGGRARGRARP